MCECLPPKPLKLTGILPFKGSWASFVWHVLLLAETLVAETCLWQVLLLKELKGYLEIKVML
jgi:hypothetical protein